MEMHQITCENLSYVEEAHKIHPLLDRELAILELSSTSVTSPNLSLSALAADVDRARLVDILRRFADYMRFEEISFLNVKDVLRRNFVVLDSWEALVLESSFIFHNIQIGGYHVK